ncbi:SIR2 family protein [Roseomonas sp. E05]|uniref:SIR2 family protein n=1 Tax=Roseomonas sp. E05 TaxID=3046310 RepID=UPI0024B8E1DE|nr:SIR2 family protein [Roseomonas sp. E05]MDJ0390240.1 SIR2 family protein [Roseomonas sp. E05]
MSNTKRYSMASGPPPAATINVRETLALLDGPFAAVAAGVAEDRYAFWLGSGISFGRVMGLKQVVARVIEFLRLQMIMGSPDCRFLKALNEVLGLAQLSDEEWSRVDFARPFSEWPDSPTIAGRLVNNYARLLDIMVDGEAEDFLLWNGADVPATFADPAIEPDVEHLCIALLILEGAASDIATANWDPLIERAVDLLSGGQPAVVVCVRPYDLREPALKARLYKFHGCAALAASAEATHRPLLVARQSQINGWVARSENAPIVNRLIDIIVSKPTLMMGLSAQDANIQAIFAHAEARMPWPWPGDRPSYVFSENLIGLDQRGLLRNVYRTAYTPTTQQKILESALIRAYAKPLLVALVLHLLCSKLRRLIDLTPGTLSSADREQLKQGVVALRDAFAARADVDRLAFVRQLVEHSGRAIALFRDGGDSGAPRRYSPVTGTPMQQIAGDPSLPATGLREAAAAIGIIGAGVSRGIWSLEDVDPNEPQSGVARVRGGSGTVNIFFAANSHAALRLRIGGHIADDAEAVLVHSAEIAPAMARSPRGAPGRTGRVGVREASMAELLNEAVNSNELVQRFREQVAI